MAELILGSSSPRRHALLRSLGVDFEVMAADVDEVALRTERDEISCAARRSAKAKLAALGELAGRSVLTADTLVATGHELVGKPRDLAHARDMLHAMSAATLTIVTALCYRPPGEAGVTVLERWVGTSVTLRELDADTIEGYLATGTALDKAGGLALQAEAASFVAAVDGCWSNVVGLPVCATAELLGLSTRRPCPGSTCRSGLGPPAVPDRG